MSDPVTQMKAHTRLDYVVHAGATTTTFLRSILKGQLVGRRCPVCHKVYIPPRGACPTCAVLCTDEVPVSHSGTVTTFSIVRIPFEGQRLTPPYACAHILLDGADVPLLHIVGGCDVDDVHVGMRVEAVWLEIPQPTLATVTWFKPNGEPDRQVNDRGEVIP